MQWWQGSCEVGKCLFLGTLTTLCVVLTTAVGAPPAVLARAAAQRVACTRRPPSVAAPFLSFCRLPFGSAGLEMVAEHLLNFEPICCGRAEIHNV